MTHTINGKCSIIFNCVHLHKIWPTDEKELSRNVCIRALFQEPNTTIVHCDTKLLLQNTAWGDVNFHTDDIYHDSICMYAVEIMFSDKGLLQNMQTGCKNTDSRKPGGARALLCKPEASSGSSNTCHNPALLPTQGACSWALVLCLLGVSLLFAPELELYLLCFCSQCFL